MWFAESVSLCFKKRSGKRHLPVKSQLSNFFIPESLLWQKSQLLIKECQDELLVRMREKMASYTLFWPCGGYLAITHTF